MDISKWEQLPVESVVAKIVSNLEVRNISAEVVDTKEQALDRLKELIPDGAIVMTGSSTTLDQIGFTDLLKSGRHPWKNLKDGIMAEKDSAKQDELRKRSVLADYFLGSVHAVAEDGRILDASATGSQLPAYAFTSPNVIWVVGVQKITKDLENAFIRLREYVFPLEDQRMKNNGYAGSVIGKVMLFEKEFFPGRVHIVFVRQSLGF
ncbi:MAG: lactate utilization protein [Parcubacteria group bacterium]